LGQIFGADGRKTTKSETMEGSSFGAEDVSEMELVEIFLILR